MKKRLLALSLALALCGCSPAGEPVETAEVVYSSAGISETVPFRSVRELAHFSQVIIRATVVAKEETLLLGDTTPEDIEPYRVQADPADTLPRGDLFDIYTPYTVEITDIYKRDAARDVLAVGDVLQICAPGGIFRGIEVDRGSVELTPGQEYIIALTRRVSPPTDEPRYLFYLSRTAAIAVDKIGKSLDEDDADRDILSDYATVDDFSAALCQQVEQMLCTTSVLIESPSIGTLKGLLTVPDLLIRATVERCEDGIMIGDYADTDISTFNQAAVRAGRLSNALIASVHTPYAVTLDAIYHQNGAPDALAVGQSMQIFVQGGLVQGVSVWSENPILTPGTTYILALRRKTSDDGRVWYTLQNPGNGAVALDADGHFAPAGYHSLYLYDEYATLADFEAALDAEAAAQP